MKIKSNPPPSTPLQPPPYSSSTSSMEQEKEKLKKNNKKQQKNQTTQKKPTSDLAFKPISEVKGLRFGGQFIVKSFTVRRATPLETLRLLSLPVNQENHNNKPQFPSTTAYLPTNFTILAHHAWHTLTLGLGTKKSKVLIFVFESENLKASIDRLWPREIPLGQVNKKLIRGLIGYEMARFKFRKGAITFYVYAVRRVGNFGFISTVDLRSILETVSALNDFLDHTAMLALPNQRTINFSPPPLAMVH